MTRFSLKEAAARFTPKPETTPNAPPAAGLAELVAAHAARQAIHDELQPLYVRRNEVAEGLRQRLDAADQRADAVAIMTRRPSDPSVDQAALKMACRATERARIRNEVAEAEALIADLDVQIAPSFARYECANTAFAEARSRVMGRLAAEIVERASELERRAASLEAIANAFDTHFFRSRDPIGGGIVNRALASAIASRSGFRTRAAALSTAWLARMIRFAEDPNDTPSAADIERLFAPDRSALEAG